MVICTSVTCSILEPMFTCTCILWIIQLLNWLWDFVCCFHDLFSFEIVGRTSFTTVNFFSWWVDNFGDVYFIIWAPCCKFLNLCSRFVDQSTVKSWRLWKLWSLLLSPLFLMDNFHMEAYAASCSVLIKLLFSVAEIIECNMITIMGALQLDLQNKIIILLIWEWSFIWQ